MAKKLFTYDMSIMSITILNKMLHNIVAIGIIHSL